MNASSLRISNRYRLLIAAAFFICVLAVMASCSSSHSSSSKMNLAQEIEKALRRLMTEQRKAIEQDAPSAYETDVFFGGIVGSPSNHFAIGKWNVQVEGKSGKARFETRYGRVERFESEVIEVDLLVTPGSVVIKDWRAYQGRGTWE